MKKVIEINKNEEIETNLGRLSLAELYMYLDEAKESYVKSVSLEERTKEALKKATNIRKRAFKVYFALQKEIYTRLNLL